MSESEDDRFDPVRSYDERQRDVAYAKTINSIAHVDLAGILDGVIESPTSDGITVRLLSSALLLVLELHTPVGIYDACEHGHPDEDLAAGKCIELDDVGLTCEDARMYSVCLECCSDDVLAQSEHCAERHDHHLGGPICRTVAVIQQFLARLGRRQLEPADSPDRAVSEQLAKSARKTD